MYALLPGGIASSDHVIISRCSQQDVFHNDEVKKLEVQPKYPRLLAERAASIFRSHRLNLYSNSSNTHETIAAPVPSLFSSIALNG